MCISVRAQSCLLLSTSWTVICKLHPAWNFLRKNSRVVAISCSRGSSQPRDQTHISCISCIGKQILYHCTTWEAHSGHACFFLCSWNRPGSFPPQDLCTSFHAHKIMSSIKGQRSFSTCTSLLKVISSDRTFLPSKEGRPPGWWFWPHLSRMCVMLYSYFIFLFCMCVCFVLQSCLTLCDPLDHSSPGSSVHGIS